MKNKNKQKEEARDMKWRTGCLMLCLMVVLPLGSKALAAEAATDEKVTNLSTQVVLDDVQLLCPAAPCIWWTASW